jgi:hypothetical protein
MEERRVVEIPGVFAPFVLFCFSLTTAGFKPQEKGND